jgi:hypothetical protein
VFHIFFLILSLASSSFVAPLPQILFGRLHEHLFKLLCLAQRR